jgi:hypothetical protein
VPLSIPKQWFSCNPAHILNLILTVLNNIGVGSRRRVFPALRNSDYFKLTIRFLMQNEVQFGQLRNSSMLGFCICTLFSQTWYSMLCNRSFLLDYLTEISHLFTILNHSYFARFFDQFIFRGFVHRKYIPIFIQQHETLYRIHLYLETALHVSGGTPTHHQDHINCIYSIWYLTDRYFYLPL